MEHIKNITVKVGEYLKNGETKGEYKTIGKVFLKDGQEQMMIDLRPIVPNVMWLNTWDVRKEETADLPFQQ